MKLVFKFILFLFLLPIKTLKAQEVIPTYSDYLTDNLYLLHPSMAGASTMNKIRLTARQQWFGIKDAPSLQTLSIHGRANQKIGLGGIVFNDQNGNFSTRGIYGTFAYHILFSRPGLELNQLSFGISAGLIQHSLDLSRFSGPDPLIGNTDGSDFYGTMDIGISYYYFNFFAHFTARNILGVEREPFISGMGEHNQRKYIFSAGYVFESLRTPWRYEPSIMLQVRDAVGETIIDVNMKLYYELGFGDLFGGISYRRDVGEIKYSQPLQYVTPFAGIEYKRFLFAYTYSRQLNSVVLSNGFHQITLGYNFGESRERYDCYCPGVN